MNRYGARPELGELKPGQKVVVYRSPNDMRNQPPEERAIPAEVVKAARVWVDLKVDETATDTARFMTWRMRRDSRDEATQYSGSNARFATLEQYEWDETRRWALGLLQENGINIERGGKWDGRQVELADILSKATPEEDKS